MRVLVASSIQHAMPMRPSVNRNLSGSTIHFFPNYLINGMIFEKESYLI